MDNSAINCDKVIESHVKKTKSNPTNFHEKKAICKTQNFCILLAVLLITIPLLIAVSIYCYLIKYQTKEKHLLPFHVTSNELKQVSY